MDSDEKNAVNLIKLIGGDEIFERKVFAEEQVLHFLQKAQEILAENKITQADLARAIGAKRSQVNRWLTNESGLNAKSMFLIAKGLGYDLKMQWCPDVPVPVEYSRLCPTDGDSVFIDAPAFSFAGT